MYFPETIPFLCSSAVQKMMFRVAFHGGIGNFWKALMTIPEVIYLFNSAFNSKVDVPKLGSTRLELIKSNHCISDESEPSWLEPGLELNNFQLGL